MKSFAQWSLRHQHLELMLLVRTLTSPLSSAFSTNLHCLKFAKKKKKKKNPLYKSHIHESNWNPETKSTKHNLGLFQISETTRFLVSTTHKKKNKKWHLQWNLSAFWVWSSSSEPSSTEQGSVVDLHRTMKRWSWLRVQVRLKTLTPPCREVAVLRLRDSLRILNVSAPFFSPTRPKPPVSSRKLPLPSPNAAISLTAPSVTSADVSN